MGSEIGVKLTGDNAEYRSMLEDSTRRGGDFAAKLADKVGDKLYGMRDVSNAVATALGLNLEKIAEKAARVWTGMSEKEEEGFKKLVELSDRASDLAIKNMRATLTEEQRYQLALQDRDRLMRQLETNAAAGGAAQAKQAELNLQLQEKLTEIREIEKRQQDELAKKEADRLKVIAETTKRGIEQSEVQTKANLDLLSGQEKLAAMLAHIEDLEGLITAEKRRGADVTQFEAALAERKRDFNKESADQAKKAADEEEKHVERQQREQDRLDKAKFEQLTTEQKIAKLEESRATLAAGIAQLGEKDEESLTMQADLQEINVKLADLRKQRAQEQIEAEKKLADQLEEQSRLLDEQIRKRTMLVTNTYGTADKDLSDRELQEKAANLTRQLQSARLANDTGQFFFEQKLKEVQYEIGYRASFRSDYAQKGEAALLDFSAFDEQRLRNYIRPEDERRAQQQLDYLADIQRRLQTIIPGPVPIRTGGG